MFYHHHYFMKRYYGDKPYTDKDFLYTCNQQGLSVVTVKNDITKDMWAWLKTQVKDQYSYIPENFSSIEGVAVWNTDDLNHYFFIFWSSNDALLFKLKFC